MKALKNTVWNLLIVILCGVLAFLLYKRGKLDKYLPEKYVSTTYLLPGPLFSFNIAPANTGTTDEKAAAQAPAAPKTAAITAPVENGNEDDSSEPVASRGATVPQVADTAGPAAPASQASAAAQPIVLSALSPQQLPREVKLLRATVFPVIFNGRPSGTFSAPAGLSVKLVRILNDKLIVQSGDAQQEVLAKDTDIYQRVAALMKR